MSVSQAGHLLGVSRSTIWRMLRRGELSSIRVGGRRLISAEALRASSARSPRRNTVPPLRKDHPIFRLVGAGRSGGNLPGARDKHSILAPIMRERWATLTPTLSLSEGEGVFRAPLPRRGSRREGEGRVRGTSRRSERVRE